MEDELGLGREELLAIASYANRARRLGFTNEQVSEELLDLYGFSRDELFSALKNLPPEKAPQALKTSDLLKAMDAGSSFGLGNDLMSPERMAELEEMGLGDVVRGMKVLGGAGSVLSLGTAATTANIARRGLGKAPELLRKAAGTRKLGDIRKVLQEISPSIGASVRGGGENVLGLLRLGLRRAPHIGAGYYLFDKAKEKLGGR